MPESEALSGKKVLFDKFCLGLFNNVLQYNVKLIEHRTALSSARISEKILCIILCACNFLFLYLF